MREFPFLMAVSLALLMAKTMCVVILRIQFFANTLES
jgi:hypothetical protein